MKHVLLGFGLLLSALSTRAQVSNTFYGTLSTTDATIVGGRLNRDGIAAVCGTTKAYPGVLATATGAHYDTYTITNPSTTSSVCATLTLTPACSEGTNGSLFASAYTGSFVSTNLATNYRSDLGASPSAGPVSMGVTLAAREVLVVVVSGTAAATTCSSYGLTVSASVALAVRGENPTAATLSAYPNPVADVLHITAAKAGSYTLYSATGAAVRQFSGSEVSLRELPGGVYMLRQNQTGAATRIVKL